MRLPTINRKTLLIASAVIVIVTFEVVTTTAYLTYKKTGKLPWTGFATLRNLLPGQTSLQVSSNTLFLTDPVYRFTGTVDKIEGNSVWITHKNMPLSQIAPPIRGKEDASLPHSPTSTPFNRDITFKVNVTKETRISRPPLSVPYYLQEMNEQTTGSAIPAADSGTENLTIKDISAGETVEITSQSDLRTLKNNEFDAAIIVLAPVRNTFRGTVAAVNGMDITVDATDPERASYTFAVTDKTKIVEISQTEPPDKNGLPALKTLSINDLFPGTEINVYADTDVTLQSGFNALSIEKISSAAPPQRQQGPSAETAPETQSVITP